MNLQETGKLSKAELRGALLSANLTNSTLIAALELFANLDKTVPSDLWQINPAYCDQARAAIAKAKGPK